MLKFHQRVQTPNGPGVIQGVLSRRNEAGDLVDSKIIVSHPPKIDVAMDDKILPACTIQGIWQLAAYEINQLTEI